MEKPKNPLQILHLEDDPADIELIAATLADEDITCEITVVDDGDSFNDLLAKQSFDLILADYALPTFDGLTALKIAKTNYPLIPFILVSGTLGEEFAIDSLKAGATDYVLKTTLRRLGSAVKRAIKESEEHRARIELEKHLQQAQKLEALGVLAGGVAHDFNNILSAILGYAELAKDEFAAGGDPTADLDKVMIAGKRASGLISQILAFSRPSAHELIPLRPQYVIKEAIKLLRASVPKTIDIHHNIATNCGTILGDPTQIHQILLNLCTNATQAMEDKGGTLDITLQTVTIDPEESRANKMSPGSYVKLEVTDNGKGMSAEEISKIFDPFYTTKRKGEGTGLGLSIVHGIVESYQGHISVESEPGKGATFKVYLRETDIDAIAGDTEDLWIPEGTEHILVVDDEESLSRMLQRMLQALGYQVTCFCHSPEALNAFTENQESFDLVITDMTMPEMNGIELAQKILSLKADTKIIAYSGHSELVNKDNATSFGFKGYLAKPVSKADLASLIRDILDA